MADFIERIRALISDLCNKYFDSCWPFLSNDFVWQEFLISGLFVWGYCILIVAFSLIAAARFVAKVSSLRRRLLRVHGRLVAIDGRSEFARQFEAYDSYVRSEFRLVWSEFVDTLELPAPGSDNLIRNTHDVSRYLNDATIIFPRISFNFYQSVPNLLMGLGILGTFIGLAAGVGVASSGLSSGNSSEITDSLRQLLAGSSLAFYTSICGISCSIVFGLVVRSRDRKLRLALNQWVEAIEFRLEQITPESIGLKQLEQADRAAKQLERFNTELVFSIQQALEEGVAGRLLPQFERLVESVEGLRSDRSTDTGQVIQQALDRFTEAMQERTGSQFEEMASIVSGLNHTLGDVTRTMTDASRQLMEDMTASNATAVAELRDTVGSVTQDLSRTGVEAASRVSDSLRGLQAAAESLERSAHQNEQVLTRMTTFVDQFDALHNTIKSAHQQIVQVTEPIGRAADNIQASVDKTGEILTQATDLVGRLEGYQAAVTGAWESYQERFEDIDGSLGEVFKQLNDGLSNYCEQVTTFSNQLDGQMGEAIGNLASVVIDLNGLIEDYSDQRSRSVQGG